MVRARSLRLGRRCSGAIIVARSKTPGLALTLAGVTGIIVSIGVTVDSYVVFFERLKDEVRLGRTLRASARARLLGRLAHDRRRRRRVADRRRVLWYLTVGSVRGFAFFLGLSTLLDLIVAYFFTRPAVILLEPQSMASAGADVLGVHSRRGDDTSKTSRW